jgi:hypothetical protein
MLIDKGWNYVNGRGRQKAHRFSTIPTSVVSASTFTAVDVGG